jgi:hypothetical protein
MDYRWDNNILNLHRTTSKPKRFVQPGWKIHPVFSKKDFYYLFSTMQCGCSALSPIIGCSACVADTLEWVYIRCWPAVTGSTGLSLLWKSYIALQFSFLKVWVENPPTLHDKGRPTLVFICFVVLFAIIMPIYLSTHLRCMGCVFMNLRHSSNFRQKSAKVIEHGAKM